MDITATQLHRDFRTLQIFNIYNKYLNNDSVSALEHYLSEHMVQTAPTRMPARNVWAGDFNMRDPSWDKVQNAHLFTEAALQRSTQLIHMLDFHYMVMKLPPNIPTLESTLTKNTTRVDNIFCEEKLSDSFIC